MRFLSIFFLCFSIVAHSQVNLRRIPLGTLDFLLYPSDAQSLGLGMGGFATNPTESNWMTNHAKIPFLESNSSINVVYNPIANGIIADMGLARINAYTKLKNNSSFNWGIQYFDGGKIDLRDDDGVSNGEFSSYTLAIQTGYSMKLSKKINGGLTFRYINSHLLPKHQFGQYNIRPASTLNTDLSLYYQGDRTKKHYFNGAAVIQNIGPKVSFGDEKKGNFQSTIFRLGGAYNLKIQNKDLISLNLDAHKMLVPTPPLYGAEGRIIKGKNLYNTSSLAAIFSSLSDAPNGFSEELSEIMISAGLEFTHANKLIGRIGYFNDPKSKGNRKLLTIGGGLQNLSLKEDKWLMNFDVSTSFGLGDFTPMNHTYMLTLSFSKNKKQQ
ncbi:hypothetical protein Emtol_0175 (plasmid) [Emticicia oligotrophica DSM 17448]|uniref:Type IX secretion system protein PorV domain-containing protein n=1 Tax=Emticicia oligotrophica (strain DSM 17448 / CIP 109782 / MTCC 6937 / GPTSA100-15) TaxID=929562 RepID=A0ABM5N7F4_EMTOG|nr:type IX secretion system outer membrane channel protein PorV [Emticicia oligotrophica]AFK05447.1 hypothetical protein Emtol_0175 [Emticicia oligotrophica DSM 17448]